MLTGKELKLLSALEPLASERGVEIVTIEIVGARKAPTIRVFIDTPEGVSFDQLASAQEWINQIMDEIDPFPGAYTLEVSSPGIDRPLRTLQHFKRAQGETVAVVMNAPIEGRSKYSGTLVEANEQVVILEQEQTRFELPFDEIKKAHIKGTIDFRSK